MSEPTPSRSTFRTPRRYERTRDAPATGSPLGSALTSRTGRPNSQRPNPKELQNPDRWSGGRAYAVTPGPRASCPPATTRGRVDAIRRRPRHRAGSFRRPRATNARGAVTGSTGNGSRGRISPQLTTALTMDLSPRNGPYDDAIVPMNRITCLRFVPLFVSVLRRIDGKASLGRTRPPPLGGPSRCHPLFFSRCQPLFSVAQA
jgi:hypothetical protein